MTCQNCRSALVTGLLVIRPDMCFSSFKTKMRMTEKSLLCILYSLCTFEVTLILLPMQVIPKKEKLDGSLKVCFCFVAYVNFPPTN